MNKKILTMLMLTGFAIGISACSGGGSSSATERTLTGTVNLASASASLSRFASKNGGPANTTIESCTDVMICCYNTYADSWFINSTRLGGFVSECEFSIPLETGGQVYTCGLFTGEDADSNACADTYIANLGCQTDNWWSGGGLPWDPDADTVAQYDNVQLGNGTIVGGRYVSEYNPCAQVDSDGDGLPNGSGPVPIADPIPTLAKGATSYVISAEDADTDDDGDGVLDTEDNQFGDTRDGYLGLDSNSDGIPDAFQESIWQALDDSDSDGIPDFFDPDVDCTDITGDENGDCLTDAFDICGQDTDGDGFNLCMDCDDDDATSTTACFYDEDLPFDYCSIDSDADGLDVCRDCDDDDASVSTGCFETESGNLCESIDADGDGFNYCYDCNDYDTASTFECYDESSDFCNQDNDSDGTDVCSDCDDLDSAVTTECYSDYSFCEDDADADGVGYCEDCDDTNAELTNDCSTEE